MTYAEMVMIEAIVDVEEGVRVGADMFKDVKFAETKVQMRKIISFWNVGIAHPSMEGSKDQRIFVSHSKRENKAFKHCIIKE